MSSSVLYVFKSEGFEARAIHENGRVHLVADADIDADGANGQNGKVAAYRVDDKGSEALANGGMKIVQGRVVGASSWYKNIVILEGGHPRVFPGGVIASKTAYRYPNMAADDPAAYVDSETVPYIVVSSHLMRMPGVVLGCKAQATNLRTGQVVVGVVADVGPRHKIGEVSIEMARQLGLRSSPRNGGVSEPIIRYEFWPGVAAEVGGKTWRLQRLSGGYV